MSESNCQYCGRRLTVWSKIASSGYCSAEHRRQHRRKAAILTLARRLGAEEMFPDLKVAEPSAAAAAHLGDSSSAKPDPVPERPHPAIPLRLTGANRMHTPYVVPEITAGPRVVLPAPHHRAWSMAAGVAGVLEPAGRAASKPLSPVRRRPQRTRAAAMYLPGKVTEFELPRTRRTEVKQCSGVVAGALPLQVLPIQVASDPASMVGPSQPALSPAAPAGPELESPGLHELTGFVVVYATPAADRVRAVRPPAEALWHATPASPALARVRRCSFGCSESVLWSTAAYGRPAKVPPPEASVRPHAVWQAAPACPLPPPVAGCSLVSFEPPPPPPPPRDLPRRPCSASESAGMLPHALPGTPAQPAASLESAPFLPAAFEPRAVFPSSDSAALSPVFWRASAALPGPPSAGECLPASARLRPVQLTAVDCTPDRVVSMEGAGIVPGLAMPAAGAQEPRLFRHAGYVPLESAAANVPGAWRADALPAPWKAPVRLPGLPQWAGKGAPAVVSVLPWAAGYPMRLEFPPANPASPSPAFIPPSGDWQFSINSWSSGILRDLAGAESVPVPEHAGFEPVADTSPAAGDEAAGIAGVPRAMVFPGLELPMLPGTNGVASGAVPLFAAPVAVSRPILPGPGISSAQSCVPAACRNSGPVLQERRRTESGHRVAVAGMVPPAVGLSPCGGRGIADSATLRPSVSFWAHVPGEMYLVPGRPRLAAAEALAGSDFPPVQASPQKPAAPSLIDLAVAATLPQPSPSTGVLQPSRKGRVRLPAARPAAVPPLTMAGSGERPPAVRVRLPEPSAAPKAGAFLAGRAWIAPPRPLDIEGSPAGPLFPCVRFDSLVAHPESEMGKVGNVIRMEVAAVSEGIIEAAEERDAYAGRRPAFSPEHRPARIRRVVP